MDSTVSDISMVCTGPILSNSPVATPSVTNLTYNSERTLTCVSTGSPATTVSWTKDGYKLNVDGTTYRMAQTVEDRTTSTYENVLALSGDDAGVYRCTVVNALGGSSAETIGKSLFLDSVCVRVYICVRV